MDPPSLLATIGAAFLTKLSHPTLFVTALIIFVWWIYRETVWKALKP